MLSLIGLSHRLLLQSHLIPFVVLTKSFQLIRFSLRLSKGHKKTSLKAPDGPFQSRRLFKHYVLALSFYSPFVFSPPSQVLMLSLIDLSPRLLLQSYFILFVGLTKSFQLIRFSLRLSKVHKKTYFKAPDRPF